MAFLIDQLNNSGLFAQSAYSASIATYDSDGNIITATYLSSVNLTPYQTTAGMTAYATTGDVANKLDASAFNIPASSNWNSTYDTVQSNSGSWGGGGTIESYNLSAGNYINITKDDVNSAIGIETTGLNVTNWNSNYDTVNTNSGVWGGSALPISAGPGISAGIVNDTLVFRNDETVLYEGSFVANLNSSFNVSESIKNFERIRFTYQRTPNSLSNLNTEFCPNSDVFCISNILINDNSTQVNFYASRLLYDDSNLSFTAKAEAVKIFANTSISTSTGSPMTISKVVGINRINNA